LGPGVDDIDLNLEDFVYRVNSDLVGKFVNIASRCAGFLRKKFDNTLSETLDNPRLYEEFVKAGEDIAVCYEKREFSRAMRLIMNLADKANHYIDEEKPWVLVKDEDTLEKAHKVCSQGINLFRVLVTYLKPVLPATALRSEEFLNSEPLMWESVKAPLAGHVINKFKPLMNRVEDSQVEAIVEDSREN